MPREPITTLYRELITNMVAAGWTDGEIAEVLGVTRPNACLARRRLGLRPVYRGRTPERCRRARQARFEAAFEPLQGTDLACTVSALDHAIVAESRERMRAWLATRNPRSREVATLSADGWSLSQIARRLGISRERVRQLRDELVRRARRRVGHTLRSRWKERAHGAPDGPPDRRR